MPPWSPSDTRDVAILATGGKRPGEGWSGARKLMGCKRIAERVGLLVTNYENNGPHQLAEEHADFVTPLVISGFPKRWSDGKFSEDAFKTMGDFYRSLCAKYGIKLFFLLWGNRV